MHTPTRRILHAFTLVELLIVIIIIAVLAAIAIPKFVNSSERSKEAALHSDLKLYRNAIELYHNDTGAYPAALTDLSSTTAIASGFDSTGTAKTIAASDWKGPYLQAQENDPVSATVFTYSVTAGSVGKVTSSAAGNGSDGTAYSTW